jgi:hypothetical protein
MLDYLFDVPWWLPTMLIGVGAAVLFTGGRRLEKNVIRWGTIILLVGVLVGLASYLVDTPVEKAVRRTQGLVSSAANRDWTTFQTLIDPQTSVYSLKGPGEITAAAREMVERFDVTTARITGTEITQRQTVIVVTVRVYSEQRGQSALSDWRMEFQNLGQGWILYDVSALPSDQIDTNRIREALSRRRNP